jgi:hypothetical protein
MPKKELMRILGDKKSQRKLRITGSCSNQEF